MYGLELVVGDNASWLEWPTMLAKGGLLDRGRSGIDPSATAWASASALGFGALGVVDCAVIGHATDARRTGQSACSAEP